MKPHQVLLDDAKIYRAWQQVGHESGWSNLLAQRFNCSVSGVKRAVRRERDRLASQQQPAQVSP
jgi:hypothetical protein